MNKLQKVTISGADDQVAISDLQALSEKFPFVEWAILFSPKKHGEPRYPTMSWIFDIGMLDGSRFNKALHLCGGYARFFAMGKGDPEWDVKDLFNTIDDFERVQINLRNQLKDININQLSHNIFESLVHDWIIQLSDDGEDSRQFLDQINLAVRNLNPVYNVFPFLDASGGRGVAETNWKMNLSIKHLRGYAGGINPGNVESIVKQISASLPDGERFWIDMESGVRTDDKFDLKLVQDVLESCQPYVVG